MVAWLHGCAAGGGGGELLLGGGEIASGVGVSVHVHDYGCFAGQSLHRIVA